MLLRESRLRDGAKLAAEFNRRRFDFVFLNQYPKGGFRPNFGRQIAERLAGDIPGTVGIIWLKESAHMPMQEEPEAYTAALLRFLAGELDKR